jgi:protocatechuate 3,4-dioxygenase beta subunit
MRKLLCLLSVSISLSTAPVSLRAQTTYATITGTVTDQNGASLPGARIIVRNVETNCAR